MKLALSLVVFALAVVLARHLYAKYSAPKQAPVAAKGGDPTPSGESGQQKVE